MELSLHTALAGSSMADSTRVVLPSNLKKKGDFHPNNSNISTRYKVIFRRSFYEQNESSSPVVVNQYGTSQSSRGKCVLHSGSRIRSVSMRNSQGTYHTHCLGTNLGCNKK